MPEYSDGVKAVLKAANSRAQILTMDCHNKMAEEVRNLVSGLAEIKAALETAAMPESENEQQASYFCGLLAKLAGCEGVTPLSIGQRKRLMRAIRDFFFVEKIVYNLGPLDKEPES